MIIVYAIGWYLSGIAPSVWAIDASNRLCRRRHNGSGNIAVPRGVALLLLLFSLLGPLVGFQLVILALRDELSCRNLRLVAWLEKPLLGSRKKAGRDRQKRKGDQR